MQTPTTGRPDLHPGVRRPPPEGYSSGRTDIPVASAASWDAARGSGDSMPTGRRRDGPVGPGGRVPDKRVMGISGPGVTGLVGAVATPSTPGSLQVTPPSRHWSRLLGDPVPTGPQGPVWGVAVG